VFRVRFLTPSPQDGCAWRTSTASTYECDHHDMLLHTVARLTVLHDKQPALLAGFQAILAGCFSLWQLAPLLVRRHQQAPAVLPFLSCWLLCGIIRPAAAQKGSLQLGGTVHFQ
jgi:hypothetical protein